MSVAVVVSILVMAISAYFAPKGLRMLRDWLTEVRADVVSNPAQRVTMIADVGELLDDANGTFLILQNGMVQRFDAEERDPKMVVFDRYAFDLSQFAGGARAVKYSIRD